MMQTSDMFKVYRARRTRKEDKHLENKFSMHDVIDK